MNARTVKAPLLSLLFAFAILISVAGCDPFGGDEFREFVVVESYMIAERNLPVVRLSTTQPIDEVYDFRNAAITSATVRIHLMDETGQNPELTFSYRMINPGVYLPNFEHNVRPGRTYKLEAEVPDFGDVQATTVIPDSFRVRGDIPGRIVYQSTEQLEFSITPNQAPGRQNVYIFNTTSLDPSPEQLTPFYKSIIENDEVDIKDLENNPSNLINEGNFNLNPDGTIQLRFPWIGVAFYGPNRISVNSVDRNITDFIRSQDIQLGGSTLSPGEIPNAVYHVDGGIGVFGGVASDTLSTFVERP